MLVSFRGFDRILKWIHLVLGFFSLETFITGYIFFLFLDLFKLFVSFLFSFSMS